MAEREVCAAVTNIPVALNEALKPLLKQEGLTMSSLLRLFLEDFYRNGKPCVAIPDEARNQARKRGALQKSAATFFG
ncbi:hypothetical protein V4C53_30165 [Paraburkholderia azotifigens]|uniref:hypothetical protein n=1 Tax=Paraburkholderia azotifigens TaxID=2057004 RepID=UPI00317392F4